MTDDGSELSRLDRATPILYVDRLTVAPWNDGKFLRAQSRPPPELAGLGSFWISRAVDLSESVGHAGWLGLHSLADAASWYTKTVRLKPFPTERYPDGEWLYFEGDPGWAGGWRTVHGERS